MVPHYYFQTRRALLHFHSPTSQVPRCTDNSTAQLVCTCQYPNKVVSRSRRKPRPTREIGDLLIMFGFKNPVAILKCHRLLATTTHKCLELTFAINESPTFHLISVQFSRIFDRVWHSRLTRKLWWGTGKNYSIHPKHATISGTWFGRWPSHFFKSVLLSTLQLPRRTWMLRKSFCSTSRACNAPRMNISL